MRYRVSIQIHAPTAKTNLAVVSGLSDIRPAVCAARGDSAAKMSHPASIKKRTNCLRSCAADASRFYALVAVQRRPAAPRLDKRYASVVYLRSWSQTVCPDRWARRTTRTVPPPRIAPCVTPMPEPSNRGWDRGASPFEAVAVVSWSRSHDQPRWTRVRNTGQTAGS